MLVDFGSDRTIIKLGPAAAGDRFSKKWKEKGRTQIFIWYDDISIDSIQFQYVENGSLVLSPKYGSTILTNYSFEAVRFDCSSEHLISLSVCCDDDNGRIASLTFGTNQGTYGPYGVQDAKEKTFHYEMGEGQFAGFYGTEKLNLLMSIGVYFKPVTSLSISRKIFITFEKMKDGLNADFAKLFSVFSLEGFFFVFLIMFVMWLILALDL